MVGLEGSRSSSLPVGPCPVPGNATRWHDSPPSGHRPEMPLVDPTSAGPLDDDHRSHGSPGPHPQVPLEPDQDACVTFVVPPDNASLAGTPDQRTVGPGDVALRFTTQEARG